MSAALRTVRRLAPLSRLSLRSQPVQRISPRLATLIGTRTFHASTSSLRQSKVSTQLAEKLGEEISYEAEMAKDVDPESVPQFLADFMETGTWDVQDTAGNDEVFLTRKFGDESIRVMFSIADLQSIPEEDEEVVEGEEEEESPIELRVSLSISKPSHEGAMNADLYCTSNAFQIANWGFYQSARIGQDLTIESDFARRTVYTGPMFETLDAGLQENFESFLRERGIDEKLAEFVPQYAQYKEQREYVDWLKNVESFVKA
ncbi:mitochondrial glycoprotein [Favolaschia claudopus]|uniref:Mitochondrial glycoprotein n=1 Tax=Favolaschia claudopus TaxID=2862362 RepID=A0AAW0CZT1_9AGAR